MPFRSSRNTKKREGGSGSGENKKPAVRSCFRSIAPEHATTGAPPEGLVHSGPKSKPNSGPNGEFANLGVCELVTSNEVNYSFVYA